MKNAKSAILRYGVGLAAFALPLLLALLMQRLSIKFDLSLLVIGALMAGAWYGGRGPGLMAAVLLEIATMALNNPGQAPWISRAFVEINRTGLMVILVLLVSSRKKVLEKVSLLAAIVESSPDAIVGKTPDGVITTWNAGAEKMYGYSAEEAIGKNVSMLVPEARRDELADILSKLRAGKSIRACETTRIRKGGTEIDVLLTVSPVTDRSRVIVGASAIARDITERKSLEEQLQQSQKMEAIGRLAGGVAHDFNNLLTAIIGYSQLALGRLNPSDPVHKYVTEAENAATRAVALTKQLLALSRRQVLQPRVLQLNSVVEGIEEMLRRLIGEDICLNTRLGSDAGHVKADPGQIEQVIMNLAVNARDAMPEGGYLTIETASCVLDESYGEGHAGVEPGSYTLLAVSDTGIGMDKETQARIFEPFFTTKEKGKGTGLGLSTVFGIVKQSGGHIRVYSEPGRGTTVKVYLPITEEHAEILKDSDLVGESPDGSETLLLVEDEELVRGMAARVLRMRGYTVIEAAGGSEALETCGGGGKPIDLIITDLVMPDMSGKEIAEKLSLRQPALKVLYMSGYTDAAMSRHGVLEPGTAFIEKPFTPDRLARKVRQVLDNVDHGAPNWNTALPRENTRA